MKEKNSFSLVFYYSSQVVSMRVISLLHFANDVINIKRKLKTIVFNKENYNSLKVIDL